MRLLHVLLSVVVAALLLAAPAARALVVCAADEVALQAALDAAGDNGANQNDDMEIRLVTGSYVTGIAHLNQEFLLLSSHANAVSILGGFAPGCQSRTANPGLTVLDGGNTTPVMTVIKHLGSFTIEDLTVQRGHNAFLGGGLSINAGAHCMGPCYEADVRVSRIVFQGNHTDFYCGGLYASVAAHQLRVESSLFVKNDAELNDGGVCLYGSGNLQFYGNTVADNTTLATTDVAGGLYCAGPATCQVYNNLLWSNDGAGLWLSTSSGYLSHNDFGNRGGDAPLSEIGSTHLNPHFVNPLLGNYRLAGDSPVLAISPLVIDATDLFDRPHPSGGLRDVGAYAETIFTDGNEILH
jgi:parallel beta-helix repeat protein